MKRHLIVVLINISLMISDVITFHITVDHLCLFFKKCPFWSFALPFVTTWMKLEDIMLSEISQTHKDKYCIRSLINGI